MVLQILEAPGKDPETLARPESNKNLWKLGADNMREAGLLLTHLGFPTTSQVWSVSCIIWRRNIPGQ